MPQPEEWLGEGTATVPSLPLPALWPAAPRALARAVLSDQQGDWHVLKAFFPANSEKPKKGRLLWKGCKILHEDFKLETNSHLPGTVGWKWGEGFGPAWSIQVLQERDPSR